MSTADEVHAAVLIARHLSEMRASAARIAAQVAADQQADAARAARNR